MKYFSLMSILYLIAAFGLFVRILFQTTDLGTILQFQKTISAFISYERYCGQAPIYQINYPSFNIIDVNSLLTWNNIRKLGLQIKKKECIPIDLVNATLFIYFVILMALWAVNYLLQVSDFGIFKNSWSLVYFFIDLVLILSAFIYRIYDQARINEEFQH